MIQGKIAVVTGGTKGIGFAVAEALARRGASVYVCGRNAEDVANTVDRLLSVGKAAGSACDVRSEEDVHSMLGECVSVFGGLDILINNAGIAFPGKTVEEISGEEFRQTVETNLFGVFYGCHYAVPLMRSRGGGYIINISSLAGQNAHPRMAAYNASKFGLNGFSEALMQEVRQDNIKVTYICPGSVNTHFGDDTPSPDKGWQIQPDDIARLVVDVLEMDPRVLPSKIEVRPSKPPVR